MTKFPNVNVYVSKCSKLITVGASGACWCRECRYKITININISKVMWNHIRNVIIWVCYTNDNIKKVLNFILKIRQITYMYIMKNGKPYLYIFNRRLFKHKLLSFSGYFGKIILRTNLFFIL